MFNTLCLRRDWKLIYYDHLLCLFLCDSTRHSQITLSSLGFFLSGSGDIVTWLGDTSHCTYLLVDYMGWTSEVQVRADHDLRLVLGVEPFREMLLEIGSWLLFNPVIIINLRQLRLRPRTLLLLLFLLTTVDILTVIDPVQVLLVYFECLSLDRCEIWALSMSRVL